jgi:DNA-binding response OmpR family regulator
MTKENDIVNILVVDNDLSETADIKSRLNQDMHIPCSITYYPNLEEAHPNVNEADLLILNPERKGLSTRREIFKDINYEVFETPIIVLTDDNHEQDSLSTYVMKRGAADTVIKGKLSRLADAVEFALMRQKITTDKRKTSDKIIQDNKDAGDIKYKHICDKRLKEREEAKTTLSMFMGDYSATNN